MAFYGCENRRGEGQRTEACERMTPNAGEKAVAVFINSLNPLRLLPRLLHLNNLLLARFESYDPHLNQRTFRILASTWIEDQRERPVPSVR